MTTEIEEGMKRDFRSKPVHIAWAMKDVAFLPAYLDTLWFGTFPDATVTKIDDAGHYLQKDAHERIVPELGASSARTGAAERADQGRPASPWL